MGIPRLVADDVQRKILARASAFFLPVTRAVSRHVFDAVTRTHFARLQIRSHTLSALKEDRRT